MKMIYSRMKVIFGHTYEGDMRLWGSVVEICYSFCMNLLTEPWRALGSLGEICYSFYIDLLKKLSLGELQALTDRFAVDSVLILLRKRAWRAPSSDGQICNGFCIGFLKCIWY